MSSELSFRRFRQDAPAGNFSHTRHDIETYRATGQEGVLDHQFVARTRRTQKFDRADLAKVQRDPAGIGNGLKRHVQQHDTGDYGDSGKMSGKGGVI